MKKLLKIGFISSLVLVGVFAYGLLRADAQSFAGLPVKKTPQLIIGKSLFYKTMNPASTTEMLLTAQYPFFIKGDEKGLYVYKNNNQSVTLFNYDNQNIANLNSKKDVLISTTTIFEIVKDQSGQEMYKIPPGKNAYFQMVSTMDPREAFGGRYATNFEGIIVSSSLNPKDMYFLQPDSKGFAGTLTIVGEKSPYITGLTPATSGKNITIRGERLNHITGIYIDGINVNVPSQQYPDSITFLFPPISPAAYHSLYLEDSLTGKSNIVGFKLLSPADCPTITRTLLYSSTGEDVTALQNFLNSKGYSIPVTGYYGLNTYGAVWKYQLSKFITPTGLVGPDTYKAIAAECGGGEVKGDSMLIISKSSASPEDSIILVDDVNDTKDIVLLEGTLKAEGSTDLNIDELPITLITNGDSVQAITGALKLRIGNKLYTESVPPFEKSNQVGTVIFDSLDFRLKSGDATPFKIYADVNDINNTGASATDFDEGDYLMANLTASNRDMIDVEDSEGNQLSKSQKSGSAIGEAQEFRLNGIGVTLVSTNTNVTSGSMQDDDTGLFTIKYKITAIGSDIYVGALATSTNSPAISSSRTSAVTWMIDKAGVATSSIFETATIVNNTNPSWTANKNYLIEEGDSETFTLTVAASQRKNLYTSGQYRLALTGIRWDKADLPALNNTYTSSLEEFKTSYLLLGPSSSNPTTPATSTPNCPAGYTCSASLTVVSPNGGEKVSSGAPVTLRWNSTGIPSSDMIYLTVSKKIYEGTVKTVFSEKVLNTGSYIWNVPTNLTDSSDYKVTIGKNDNNFSAPFQYYDQSDNYFTITPSISDKPVVIATTTITTIPSVTLLSPNGGEKLIIGQTYPFKFNVKNANSNYRLALSVINYSGYRVENLLLSTKGIILKEGDNTYNLVIPESVGKIGSSVSSPSYRIEAMLVSDAGYPYPTDFSDGYVTFVSTSQVSATPAPSNATTPSCPVGYICNPPGTSYTCPTGYTCPTVTTSCPAGYSCITKKLQTTPSPSPSVSSAATPSASPSPSYSASPSATPASSPTTSASPIVSPSPSPSTTVLPKISTTQSSVSSGSFLNLSVTLPSGATEANIYMSCPTGVTSSPSNVCNNYYSVLGKTSMPVTLYNSTAQSQSVYTIMYTRISSGEVKTSDLSVKLLAPVSSASPSASPSSSPSASAASTYANAWTALKIILGF